MTQIRITLDKRRARKDGTYPLKLTISHKQETSYIQLDIYIEESQWDAKLHQVINHSNKKFYKSFLNRRLIDAESYMLEMSETIGLSKVTAKDIRDFILKKINKTEEKVSFVDYAYKYIERKHGGTKHNYGVMMSHVERYCISQGKEYDKLAFDDITKDWIIGFDNCLKEKLSATSNKTMYAMFSAILNNAIEEGIIKDSFHKKIKHKTQKTRSRALEIDDLRIIMNYETSNEKVQYAVDIFKLTFFLIGINFKDLCNLTHDSVHNGRIRYIRAKTSKDYNIKIEKEAQELIDKYKGNKYLINVLDFVDDYKYIHPTINHRLCKVNLMHEKVISLYWARHSWATIAHQLKISKDVISMALGHSFGISVTDVYIDYNAELIDEANRKVIDYVLYNKK